MPAALRTTLITFSIAFLAVAACYRIRSQRSGESLDRTKEGWFILIAIRVTGALLMGSTIAWMYDPSWLQVAAVPVPEGVRWLGMAGLMAAGCWLLWMFHSLGHNLTDTVVTRKHATFVDSGPYRFVRNPMYTGVLVLGLTLGLVLGTWLTALLAVLIFTLHAIRTRTEERYLIERFGDTYRQYMTRVGRFFPKL